MKIGLVTDSLDRLSLDTLLTTAAGLSLDCLEFGTGCWSGAPHLAIGELLGSEPLRRNFTARIEEHGLEISALNCSGNPLHPGPSGEEHARITRWTIDLAALLGVRRVVMMSGCPGGPGDLHPNWVTVAWPPETTRILEWQWNESVLPYWRELAPYARARGIDLCLELHGHQNVYNVETFFRLREAIGDVVGVNLDPSHLMWMGADPIAAVEALGEFIYHVHAKDTRTNPELLPVNGLVQTRPAADHARRSWNYVTLGHGRQSAFWGEFCSALSRSGYNDVLSIEHEDVDQPPLDGVTESVELLRSLIATT
ncbi:MAG: sugar phosphate isomerase/epimerase [Trueperaceae bacterium]